MVLDRLTPGHRRRSPRCQGEPRDHLWRSPRSLWVEPTKTSQSGATNRIAPSNKTIWATGSAREFRQLPPPKKAKLQCGQANHPDHQHHRLGERTQSGSRLHRDRLSPQGSPSLSPARPGSVPGWFRTCQTRHKPNSPPGEKSSSVPATERDGTESVPPRAPSIRAASRTARGMDCKPARKKMKL